MAEFRYDMKSGSGEERTLVIYSTSTPSAETLLVGKVEFDDESTCIDGRGKDVEEAFAAIVQAAWLVERGN